MKGIPRSERARLYDATGLSPATAQHYSKRIRPYVADAEAAGENPRAPSTAWLLAELEVLSNKYTRQGMVATVTALTFYFNTHGVHNPLNDDTVFAFLRAPRYPPDDPQVAEIAAAGDLFAPIATRIRWYAGREYAPATRALHDQYQGSWETYAAERRLSTLHPTPHTVAAFLSWHAEAKSGVTVAIIAKALSAYFRQRGVPDVTKDPLVRKTLAGIQRDKPPAPRLPMSGEHLRSMLATIGTESPLDIRDRALLLISALGHVSAEKMPTLRREGLEQRRDHLLITTTDQSRPFVYVGYVDDPVLDIRQWLQKWLDKRGDGDGPLFVARDPRGFLSGNPLQATTINEIASRAAKRAGIHVPRVMQSIYKGFVIAADAAHGATVTAAYLNIRQRSTLNRHTGYHTQGTTHRRFSRARKRLR